MPPVHLYAPYICRPHTTPVHLYVFPIQNVPHMSCGCGGHLYTPCVLESLEGISTFCQAFLCLSAHPFASQFIKVIPVGSHHGGLLLYWTGCLWMYAMLGAVVPFFVVFIMSQASTTTSMTTTPPVTVVCSSTSSLLSMVTMPPCLMGLAATSGQHDVVLPPLLIPRYSESIAGLTTVPQQQPPPQMLLQANANYAMGPSQVGFFFRVEPPTVLYFMFGVCSGVCFQLSGAMLDAVFTYGGSTIGVCNIATLLSLPMGGMCATW